MYFPHLLIFDPETNYLIVSEIKPNIPVGHIRQAQGSVNFPANLQP
jgi:hypothetical protein